MPVDPDAVVDAVFRGLQVDAQWSVREEDGFTWWPSGVRQVVRAEAPRDVLGEEITRVTVEVPLVTGVTAEEPALLSTLANADSVLNGGVYDRRTGTVCRRLAVSLWDGNRAWLQPLLIHAAAVQQTVVSTEQVEELARLLGGTPDLAPHPGSGPRTVPDEMTEVGALYVAAGARTAVTPRDFRDLADAANGLVPVRPRGPSASVALEGDVGWSLTSTRHPVFGFGLLSLLSVPFGPDVRAGAAMAARLNVADSLANDTTHFLGGWLHDGRGSLVHHVFVPELVSQQAGREDRVARMMNLLLDATIRGRWARLQLLTPEVRVA